MKIIKGFTIAEIIITMAIIGIVAVMAVPLLNQNAEDQKYKALLKKTFSNLSNAMNLINANEGGFVRGPTNILNSTTNLNYNHPFLAKYLQPIKTCTGADRSTSGECVSLNYGDLTVNCFSYNLTGYQMILKDGSSISIWDPYLYIDVNGLTPPNILGKDGWYFVYDYTNNIYIPTNISTVVSGKPFKVLTKETLMN